MPRGDGSGPWGNGPQGRGRGICRQVGFGNQFGARFGRGMQCSFGFTKKTPIVPETLEAQAERLEAQATSLRILAKQNITI